MTKKITIENLAGMIQQEFSAIHDEMKEGFENVNTRIDSVERRVENIEYQIAMISETLKSIQAEIKELKKMEFEIFDLKSRVERIEHKLGLAK